MSAVPRSMEWQVIHDIGYAGHRQKIRSWGIDRLLVSDGHYRIGGRKRITRGPSGKGALKARWGNQRWSGGGAFFTWKAQCLHKGEMFLPHTAWGLNSGGFNLLGLMPMAGYEPDFQRLDDPFIPHAPRSWVYEQAALQGRYLEGFNKAKPGAPDASSGQFLAELKEVPRFPSFLKDAGMLLHAYGSGKTFVPWKSVPLYLLSRLEWFKSLGSDYLNVQFGWKPFVSDLQSMYSTWKDMDKKIAKLIRENGKSLRRQVTVYTDETDSMDVQDVPYPYWQMVVAPAIPPNGKSHYILKRKQKEHYWFVGRFRYYIDNVRSNLWDLRARAALFGVLPTPDLLWQVLPWSWLLDWFVNFGDILSAISPGAVDNLIMEYGFLMRHYSDVTVATSTVTHDGAYQSGYMEWPAVTHTFASTYTVESKSRIASGNPFGLGVKYGDLNDHQIHILAALGISRAKLV